MIPVTYEPLEGVVVDVQDHARRTGTMLDRYTWGDDQFRPPWGLRAHQMDVETPTRGKDRTEGFAQERRRTSCRGTPTELDLGGLCPFE
jgi:hypothetical protein